MYVTYALEMRKILIRDKLNQKDKGLINPTDTNNIFLQSELRLLKYRHNI